MTATETSQPYRVLARKYRPQTFADLVGQEVLVTTLSNAIATGRIAHAYLLTGIRGIGKTTTARIIARALNCIGKDGESGPTADPCGVCEHCTAIAEDRHVDVLEMDAASRTGVGDVRELIEAVRYRPASARYKVYIIDEVHMLSNAAFNALLKTLEEPPAHTIFIFATTEIQKIPVTILSRCQRFDLRRLDTDALQAHLAAIAEKESAALEPEALRLLATAAEGSVRDGLSLLDRAIAHFTQDAPITEAQARDMLGISDRGHIFAMLRHLLDGEIVEALTGLQDAYREGADPVAVLQALMEATHLCTRIKTVPTLAATPELPEGEREAAKALAEKLGIPVLTRLWQMLLKGHQEALTSPDPLAAAEMIFIRIAYTADLPTPDEAIRQLKGNSASTSPGGGSPPAASGRGGRNAASAPAGSVPAAGNIVAMPARMGSSAAPAIAQLAEETEEMENIPTAVIPPPVAESADASSASPPADRDTMVAFSALVETFRTRREGLLHHYLHAEAECVSCEPGKLVIHPLGNLPPDFCAKVADSLTRWQGERWMVAVSSERGAPSLTEQERARFAAEVERVSADPNVAAVLDAFPGAKVVRIEREG